MPQPEPNAARERDSVPSTRSRQRRLLAISPRSDRFVRMSHLRMNERAWSLADDAANRADELRVAVHSLPCGARVIDAGVEVAGGFGAGQLLSHLCMGGL